MASNTKSKPERGYAIDWGASYSLCWRLWGNLSRRCRPVRPFQANAREKLRERLWGHLVHIWFGEEEF